MDITRVCSIEEALNKSQNFNNKNKGFIKNSTYLDNVRFKFFNNHCDMGPDRSECTLATSK
jgi:hypothetical protein